MGRSAYYERRNFQSRSSFRNKRHTPSAVICLSHYIRVRDDIEYKRLSQMAQYGMDILPVIMDGPVDSHRRSFHFLNIRPVSIMRAGRYIDEPGDIPIFKKRRCLRDA